MALLHHCLNPSSDWLRPYGVRLLMVSTTEKVIAFIIALSSQIGPADEKIEAEPMALVTSDQETETTTGNNITVISFGR